MIPDYTHMLDGDSLSEWTLRHIQSSGRFSGTHRPTRQTVETSVAMTEMAAREMLEAVLFTDASSGATVPCDSEGEE